MINKIESQSVNDQQPQEVVNIAPGPRASELSAYTASGEFLAKTDELIGNYDANAHEFIVTYKCLKEARDAMGRSFNNTDSVLAEGSVTYKTVVTNALKVWPVKGLGKPSWPNAPY